MDATSFNQSNQMPASPGAHDRRSGDNRDFAASAVDAAQFLRDFANDGRLGFLGVNNVVDELKWIRVRGGSLHRHNTDSLVSENDLVAFFDVEKLNGTRAAFFPINRDCAIDDRRRHLDLLTAEANKCLLIGGYVELRRKNAVGWRCGSLSVCALQYFSALLAKPPDQLVQRFASFGGRFDSSNALIYPLPNA